MTYSSPESRYQIPLVRLLEGYFEYVDTHTIRLHISAIDGYVKILVEDGDRRQYVDTEDVLECDLAVSGAGGLHNAYAEQVSTCYVVYAAWNSTTAERNGDLCLFAVPSGTVVNYALVSALTGGMGIYDMWSLPIAFVVNSAAGNIQPFVCVGPKLFWFTPMFQVMAQNANTPNYAAVNLSGSIPWVYGAIARFSYYSDNQNVPDNWSEFGFYDGTTVFNCWGERVCVVAATFVKKLGTGQFDVPIIHDPATLLQFRWTAAPSWGTEASLVRVCLWM